MNFFKCPIIFKKSTKWPNSYFCVLCDDFSQAQLTSAFVPQKDFYYVHGNTGAFFLFLLQ